MSQTHQGKQPLEREHFRELAMTELDAVYRFALHLSRDALVAEDLVQETYLRALRSADTFSNDSGTIRPWLFKILHNLFRARLRRSGVENRVMEEVIAPETETAIWDEPVHEEGQPIDWEQVEDPLKDAIHSLPDDLRATFLLFAAEDLKYRQIAQVLEIPIGTVMSRLSRARKKLIQTLKTPSEDVNKVPGLRVVNRDETGPNTP